DGHRTTTTHKHFSHLSCLEINTAQTNTSWHHDPPTGWIQLAEARKQAGKQAPLCHMTRGTGTSTFVIFVVEIFFSLFSSYPFPPYYYYYRTIRALCLLFENFIKA
ncbi:hypothetical protein WUBG_09453, partial [Wuchereria bancrofti]